MPRHHFYAMVDLCLDKWTLFCPKSGLKRINLPTGFSVLVLLTSILRLI